jgi:hypothetical protein
VLDKSNLNPIVLIQEFRRQPPEDVVHDRLRQRYFPVIGVPGGFKAHMTELVDQRLEWHPVLKGERYRSGKRIHEPRDGTALFRHDQEDFPGRAIIEHAYGDVAFMTRNRKFVGNGRTLIGQTPA